MKMLVSLICILSAAIMFSGCANGAGKEIAKGAIRGGSHGVIDKRVDGPVAEGAAHGALNSTHKVVDQNRAERKANRSE